MAETTAAQKASYPLPVYNFMVTVEGQSVSFAEVSGLDVEYDSATYRHGLSFSEGEAIARYRYPKYSSLVLKKATLPTGSYFYAWLTAKGAAERALEISLCDETGVPVVIWRIARAIPVKLTAANFDANSNQLSIETLDLKVSGISLETS